MATAPKFRIDVDIHDLLMDSSREPARPAAVKGLTLPEPVFPQYPEKLVDPGPKIAPEKRDWSLSRFSGAILGPGSTSFSGYWGNTGSGSVSPFTAAGLAGSRDESISRS